MPTVSEIEQAVHTLLTEIGEDPTRQGLRDTPGRVRRMYAELTDGYRTDADAVINDACFDVDYDEMVVVRDIEF
jgi:GTP cyclohydrolase I